MGTACPHRQVVHTERLVPADDGCPAVCARILALRAQAPPAQLGESAGLLLPRSAGRLTLASKGCLWR